MPTMLHDESIEKNIQTLTQICSSVLGKMFESERNFKVKHLNADLYYISFIDHKIEPILIDTYNQTSESIEDSLQSRIWKNRY